MNDKQSSDDEFIDDNFDTEFEFDEGGSAGAAPTPPSKPTGSAGGGGSRKIILAAVGVAVLGFLGYVGYKFLLTPSKPDLAKQTALPAAKSALAKMPSSKPVASAKEVGPRKSAAPTAFTADDLNELTKTGSLTTQTAANTATTAAASSVPGHLPPATTAASHSKPATVTQTSTTVELVKDTSVTAAKSTGPANEAGKDVISAESKDGAGIGVSQTIQVEKLVTPPLATGTATKPGAGQDEKSKEAMAKTPEVVITTTTTPIPGAPLISSVPATESSASELSAPPLDKAHLTLVQDAKPTPRNPADLQEMTEQMQKTLEAFTKLTQQMETNLNQIKYLDSYTREVSLTVEKLNAQTMTMDNRVQALTNLANSLSKDLGKVRNEVGYVKRVIGDEGMDGSAAPVARRQRSSEYPVMVEDGIDCNGAYSTGGSAPARSKSVVSSAGADLEYVVHAVIPGRAWLKSAKGQIITVTEGETIGNYGKILVIDATNSVVLTSAGVTFR